jgi:prepilin-type N-terminal cleavage/methylation domain-containing protein
MRENGFSLVELLVVIVISGTLLAISSLYFSAMTVKNGIEREMKEMYADLMTIRSEALFQKKTRSVTITATIFSVYSSNNVGVTPLSSKTLSYAVNLFLYPSSSPATLQIDYDNRGVATFGGDNTILKAAVCAQMTGKSSIDTVAATQTIVQMGRQKSAGCSYDNTAVQ